MQFTSTLVDLICIQKAPKIGQPTLKMGGPTCGKLLTGVTVPQWGAIFMLRETKSTETYFQAAFRVQSPWTRPIASDPHKQEIVKPVYYIFDFAQNRALEMIYGFCAHQADAKKDRDTKSEVRVFFELPAYPRVSRWKTH